jgi:hypothetical protein
MSTTPQTGISTSHYKQQSDRLKVDAMSADIAGKITLLQNSVSRPRADLTDLEAVQQITYQYMNACKDMGVFPTVLGLSASLGISRQGLNKHLREHPESDTAKFIEVVKDVFADIMTNSALFRNADSATTIFVLKNCAGFSDRLEIQPVTQEPLGGDVNYSELEARIAGSVVLDDEGDDE